MERGRGAKEAEGLERPILIDFLTFDSICTSDDESDMLNMGIKGTSE